MRHWGIEAKYWLMKTGRRLKTMPSQLIGYRRITPEGMFHVQYRMIEFSSRPRSDITAIGQLLRLTDSIVRRETRRLGYDEAGLDHIHLNIELTEAESRWILGSTARFGTVKIFLPKTDSFRKIERLSESAGEQMGNTGYHPDGMLIRRGESICYHTWFRKITVEGLRRFYKSIDAFLKTQRYKSPDEEPHIKPIRISLLGDDSWNSLN